MQKTQQSWWLVLGIVVAVFMALPVVAQENGSASESVLPCDADPALAALSTLETSDLEVQADLAAVLALEAPVAEPLTGPPGSCPHPTCDARVHCLWLACPAGQSAACFGGLGAGCEGTCGCR